MRLLALLAACNSALSRPPDYHQDVAPLLAHYCQDCHHAGGVAPVPSLADYENVRTYSEPIRMAAETRWMPQWSADDSGSCGTWKDARGLGDAEIASIVRWQE